jgi:hypothetical protein
VTGLRLSEAGNASSSCYHNVNTSPGIIDNTNQRKQSTVRKSEACYIEKLKLTQHDKEDSDARFGIINTSHLNNIRLSIAVIDFK